MFARPRKDSGHGAIMSNMAATGFIKLTEIVEPADEGGFVAFCPELDVSSQGESIDESFANLRDAVYVFLETMKEFGDLGAYLKRRQIRLHSTEPRDKTHIEITPGEVVSTFVARVDTDLVPA